MGFLTGKDKSKSTQLSSNAAHGDIKNAFGGLMPFAQQGGNALQALLGGDASGFNAFKSATGFAPLMEGGSRGITGNAAASGLLRSGSTGKSLMNFGNTMQNQFANNYMDRLLGQANMGFQAGSLIADTADQRTDGTSTSKKKPGLGSILGGALSTIGASDRRLKKDIRRIGTLHNGLGLYEYHYINGYGPYTGVMADEVATIQPEALGPIVGGYATVDYSKINLIPVKDD